MEIPRSGEGDVRWLPVVGWEETHMVSDRGDVWSRPRKHTRGGLLVQSPRSSGHLVVSLCFQRRQITKDVHRLVAAAFIGPCPDGQEVRHLNSDPTDNRVENLAYGTRSENVRDAVNHGSHNQKRKTHCPQGHPYNEANTYYTPTRPNARYCRPCTLRRVAEQRQRERAALSGATV